jgi:hydroxyacylglutathione hydrolase
MLTISQFTFNPMQENTYVISDDKGACIIIDPGCYYEEERKELTDFIDMNKMVPKCLLNTHCHLDHIFGNKFIAERYGLMLHIHKKEKPVLDHGPASGLKWGLPFENYAGELQYLEEGKDVVFGENILEVLFTPGHSPGSVSFYCKDEKFVMAGDVLFRLGIGRTDLPGGDQNTLLRSIRDQLFVLPDDVIVYSGHGPETTIGYEKKNNPFLAGNPG